MKGWAELKEAFWAAVYGDPAERARHVAALGSIDPALPARLDALLAADDQGESLQHLLQSDPARPELPARIGIYDVIGVLGVGGMGEVYRAYDVRLQREVAIKVLPAAVTNDAERRARFEREAQVLASLNHPNIAQVYGLDESGGMPVLVMELVPGPTLAEVIAGYPDAPLPLPRALTIARQIADGLDAAHEKGIIHRDLKPSNVALTQEGEVKILDFGVAKSLDTGIPKAPGSSIATDVGVVIGTPAYMSPEQARGLTVDKRTDIWAFGCLLYELLTGRQPFAGATASDTLVAVLEREPDLTILPAAIPIGARSLLRHCLEKAPKRRLRDIADARLAIDDALNQPLGERVVSPESPPNTAAAVAPEAVPRPDRRRHRFLSVPGWAVAGVLAGAVLTGVLLWPSRDGGPSPAPATLAVLPFENLSGDPEREYVSEGLAEETIASLGQIDPDRLSVVARSSTRVYRRTTKSAAQIGRELKADYLVEGSIRAENGRLRVTVTLIRVGDQLQIWSHSYDREPTSMLGMQQELSTAIAEQVQLRLSPERRDRLAWRQTQNADAYDLYLRARSFEERRTPQATIRAIEYYERATTLDPGYALAWVGISRTQAARILNSDADPLLVSPLARRAAAEAVRIAPDLAEAEFVSGYVKWCCDWDWPGAETSLKRAVALDPRFARAHLTLGHALSQLRRHDEAAAQALRARQIEPLSPMVYALSSQIAFQARNYRAAVEFGQQAVALDPEFWIGHIMLGQAYGEIGDINRALNALSTAASFSGQNSKTLSFRGYLHAKAGRLKEAREVLAALEIASRTKYVPPSAMALVSAGLNDADAMFAWLARAYAARDTHLIFLTVDPKWDPFREDPRFRDLLARCGFDSGHNDSR